jgi:two-component system, response regulator YesN
MAKTFTHIGQSGKSPVNKDVLRVYAYFIIILLLPVIAFTLISSRFFVATYRDEIISQNNKQTARLAKDLDDRVSQMAAIASQMTNQEVIRSRAIANEFYAYYSIRKLLQGYVTTNNFFTDMALYSFESSNTIFTTNGTYNRQLYKQYHLADSTVVNFSQMLTKVNSGSWILPQDIAWPYGDGGAVYEFVMKVPDIDQVYAVFMIPPGKLQALVDNEDSQTIILDRAGRQLYPLAEADATLIAAIKDAGRTGAAIPHEIDNDNYLLYAKSESTGMIYARVISKVVLLSPVNRIQYNFMIAILFLLVVGSGVAWFLTRSSYKPIDKLVSFTRSLGADIPNNLSGLDRARYVIQKQSQDYQVLEQKLNCGQLLVKLIYGKISNLDEVGNLCRQHGLSFNSARYRIIYIAAEAGPAVPDVNVSQICAAFLSSHFETHSIEYMHSACYLFTIGYTEISTEQLKEKMDALLLLLEEYPLGRISISVGGECPQISAIFKSYAQAVAICNAYRDAAQNQVLLYEKEFIVADRFIYPKIEFRTLAEAIQQADLDKARLISDILIDMIRLNAHNQFIAMLLCCDMINTYQSAINDLGLSMSDDQNQWFENLGILNMFDMKAIISMIYDMRDYALNLVAQNIAAVHPTDLSYRIMSYIGEQSIHADLSVSSIAAHFNLSISNVSHQFKMLTGVNLSDAINDRKMKYAEELLRCSHDTINQIASKIGYNNPSNFIRKFKCYKNMTPNEYRSIYQQSAAKVSE